MPYRKTPYRVLIVEDEYFIADELARDLAAAGIGAASIRASLHAARSAIDAGSFDFVVLDVNLGGTMAFDLARELRARAIPFAFLTGYDRDAIPDEFDGVRLFQKPCAREDLVAAIRDRQPRPMP